MSCSCSFSRYQTTLILALALCEKVISTTFSSPSPMLSLVASTYPSSNNSPSDIMSTMVEKSLVLKKKRKRRRRRNRTHNNPMTVDENNSSTEIPHTIRIGDVHTNRTTCSIDCIDEDDEVEKLERIDQNDCGFISNEVLHSSMPPFAVRHTKNNRKKRRRRIRQASFTKSTFISSSTSTTIKTSLSTLNFNSTNIQTRSSTLDKQEVEDNSRQHPKGDNSSIIPDTIVSDIGMGLKIMTTNQTAVGSNWDDQSTLTKTRPIKIGGKDQECLRRIKSEWKDAVKMGIAYDWINMRTIDHRRRRKISNTDSKSNSGKIYHDTSDHNDYIRIGPYGKNLLRWHFSVSGPTNSVYTHGIYHGVILLPRDYPASPPRVRLLTPSGRFIVDADICLTASNYHPESWTPRWTVLSLVQALRVHMLTSPSEIGGMHASVEKRREYAMASRVWRSRDGIVDHGRMVTMGMFPPESCDNDGLVTPTVVSTEDDVTLHTHECDDDTDDEEKLKPDNMRDGMILKTVVTRKSSMSSTSLSIDTKKRKNNVSSCVSEMETQATTVRIRTNPKFDNRKSNYHEIITSNTSTNEVTSTVTEMKSNADHNSKSRRKNKSKMRLSKRSSEVSTTQRRPQFVVRMLQLIVLELIKLPLRLLYKALMVLGLLLGLS